MTSIALDYVHNFSISVAFSSRVHCLIMHGVLNFEFFGCCSLIAERSVAVAQVLFSDELCVTFIIRTSLLLKPGP